MAEARIREKLQRIRDHRRKENKRKKQEIDQNKREKEWLARLIEQGKLPIGSKVSDITEELDITE